jgi:hypothetical protein
MNDNQKDVYTVPEETRELLKKRFAEYLSPDFTQRLLLHFAEARRIALLEEQETAQPKKEA